MNFLKKIFGSRGKDCGNLSYYKSLIGFTPRHVEYYEAAFTHKSVNKDPLTLTAPSFRHA